MRVAPIAQPMAAASANSLRLGAARIAAQLAETYDLVQKQVEAVESQRRALTTAFGCVDPNAALPVREKLRSLAAKVRRTKAIAIEIEVCWSDILSVCADE